eukprot:1294414-Pyramimonas_sp.AAC.1
MKWSKHRPKTMCGLFSIPPVEGHARLNHAAWGPEGSKKEGRAAAWAPGALPMWAAPPAAPEAPTPRLRSG